MNRWRVAACVCGVLPSVVMPYAWACESANDQAFSGAYAQIQSGRLAEAQAQLQSMLGPSPPRPEVLNNLAAVAHLQGDSAQALAWITQAVALMPPYASIRNNHALLSNPYPTSWSPLQLINSLPCSQAQHTAMTMAEAKFHVGTSKRIDIQEAVGQVTLAQELALQTANPNKVTEFFPSAAPLREALNTPRGPEPEPMPASALVKPLTLAMQAWAKAWRQQSPKDYLSFYASNFNFADAGAKSRAQWERLRTQRLTQYQLIDLEISELQVLDLAPNLMQVRFHQRWRGDARAPRVSKKTMTWQLQQGRWLIVSERATRQPKT